MVAMFVYTWLEKCYSITFEIKKKPFDLLVILWPWWCAIEEGRLLEVGACTRNYGELCAFLYYVLMFNREKNSLFITTSVRVVSMMSIPIFLDYLGVSPVHITKSPGQYKWKHLRYFFQVYLGRSLHIFGWGQRLVIWYIFAVHLAHLYFLWVKKGKIGDLLN